MISRRPLGRRSVGEPRRWERAPEDASAARSDGDRSDREGHDEADQRAFEDQLERAPAVGGANRRIDAAARRRAARSSPARARRTRRRTDGPPAATSRPPRPRAARAGAAPAPARSEGDHRNGDDAVSDRDDGRPRRRRATSAGPMLQRGGAARSRVISRRIRLDRVVWIPRRSAPTRRASGPRRAGRDRRVERLRRGDRRLDRGEAEDALGVAARRISAASRTAPERGVGVLTTSRTSPDAISSRIATSPAPRRAPRRASRPAGIAAQRRERRRACPPVAASR